MLVRPVRILPLASKTWTQTSWNYELALSDRSRIDLTGCKDACRGTLTFRSMSHVGKQLMLLEFTGILYAVLFLSFSVEFFGANSLSATFSFRSSPNTLDAEDSVDGKEGSSSAVIFTSQTSKFFFH